MLRHVPSRADGVGTQTNRQTSKHTDKRLIIDNDTAAGHSCGADNVIVSNTDSGSKQSEQVSLPQIRSCNSVFVADLLFSCRLESVLGRRE